MPPRPEVPTSKAAAGLTRAFAGRLVDQRSAEVPAAVRQDAALHVLDSVAAMVSASLLPGGQSILGFAGRWLDGQRGPATVVGAPLSGDPVSVARVNGMLAHADETDDSHQRSLTHPGCAVTPSALAVAQTVGASGKTLLDAIIAGYEVVARVNLSLGPEFQVRTGSRPSSHALGGVFGAAAAASFLWDADVDQTEEILSYAAQLASGVNTYLRDKRHVQKAFVFGGMPASNGVLAAAMVMAGLPGMPGVFDSEPNFLEVHSQAVEESWLREAWTAPYAVSETNIKRYPVGSPAQALVQCAEALVGRVEPDRIKSLRLFLPADSAHVVSRRASPNLDSRYLVAATLVDGRLTFARAHDPAAATRAPYSGLAEVTEVVGVEELRGTRGGGVEVTLDDGTVVVESTRVPLGTRGSPLSAELVIEKAKLLLAETLGELNANAVVDALTHLARARDLNQVAELLAKQRN